MSVPKCHRVVFWWETCHQTVCILDAGHGDDHCDGLYWFNNAGIRVPVETPGKSPGRGNRARAGQVAA